MDCPEGHEPHEWQAGDYVEVTLPMDVHQVVSNVNVKTNEGLCAYERGPLVYCAEEIDNVASYDSFLLTPQTRFTLWQPDGRLAETRGIVADNGSQQLRLIPYYAWDNREASKMKVWVKCE